MQLLLSVTPATNVLCPTGKNKIMGFLDQHVLSSLPKCPDGKEINKHFYTLLSHRKIVEKNNTVSCWGVFTNAGINLTFSWSKMFLDTTNSQGFTVNAIFKLTLRQ